MSTVAYIITRDGRPTYGRYATEDAAFGELLRRQPMSTDWAMRHEGWGISEVPDSRWSDLEARELRATAQRLFADHGHPWVFEDREERDMVRESCGACALGGYGSRRISREEGVPLQPNYAGWARAYVQAGRTIPAKWREAFEAEQHSENTAYADALALDIATFGVSFEES